VRIRDFARCLSAFGDAGLTENAAARTSLAEAVLRELSQCLEPAYDLLRVG